MTIGRIEEIIRNINRRIFYFKDKEIYKDDEETNLEFLFKSIDEIEKDTNELSNWLEDYKYKITRDMEIGELK